MTDFDCTRFQQWLDDGPNREAEAHAAGPSREADAYAATCSACGDALRAERSMLALFAAPAAAAPTAPAGFADGVLARVRVTPQERPAPARVLVPAASPAALPWWIRATAQPTGVLTLVLLGIAVWLAPVLRAAGAAAPAWGAALFARAAGLAAPLVRPLTAYLGRDPYVDAAIALAVLPLAGVLFFGLYRLGHLVATPRAFRS